MDYLALVNRARRECGVSGIDLTTLETANLSQEGLRFKTWVNEAFREIQLHKSEWDWMRKSTTFNTVVGQSAYTLAQSSATDCASWKRDSFRAYLTASGVNDEQLLPFMEYETFRNVYQWGAMRTTQQRPSVFTIAPRKTLILGAVPDAVYTVVADYYRTPVDLDEQDDDPSDDGFDFPERYHMLIVYRAMLAYAAYESAPEVHARALDGVKRMQSRLEYDYAPTLVSGPPLA